MRGTNPAWANLPRRKCDDCGKNYKPKQPLREGTRGFCTDNCRKSYHKHGGAYRKLKVEMVKLVTREMAATETRLRALVREELLATMHQMLGKDVADIGAWQRAATESAALRNSPAAHRANR